MALPAQPPPPKPRGTGGTILRLSQVMVPNREPTAKEQEAIDEVLALAREFDGSPEHVRAARITTTGRQRFLAARFTPPSEDEASDFKRLMRMLDALIAADNETIETHQGSFRKADLIEAEMRLSREDGKEVICLPIRHPWRVKPDRERGIEGVRDPAVYRRKEERGPDYGTFQIKPRTPTSEAREHDWWEVEDE